MPLSTIISQSRCISTSSILEPAASQMASDRGYVVINCAPASQELITAAKAEISVDQIHSLQTSTSDLGYEKLGWGERCDELFHHGLDLADNTFLIERCGSPERAMMMGQTVFILMRNPEQLKRWRARPGGVIIYRSLEEELGPEHGFIKIVEGSHRMPPSQVTQAEAKPIRLRRDQAILVDGDVVIEYPPSGGGLGMLSSLDKK